MNKKEFVSRLAERLGTSQKAAGEAFDAFVEQLVEALNTGNPVQLNNVVRLQLADRAPRDAINPRTGEKVRTKGGKRIRAKIGTRWNA